MRPVSWLTANWLLDGKLWGFPICRRTCRFASFLIASFSALPCSKPRQVRQDCLALARPRMLDYLRDQKLKQCISWLIGGKRMRKRRRWMSASMSDRRFSVLRTSYMLIRLLRHTGWHSPKRRNCSDVLDGEQRSVRRWGSLRHGETGAVMYHKRRKILVEILGFGWISDCPCFLRDSVGQARS